MEPASHPAKPFSFSLKEEAVSSGEVADLEQVNDPLQGLPRLSCLCLVHLPHLVPSMPLE